MVLSTHRTFVLMLCHVGMVLFRIENRYSYWLKILELQVHRINKTYLEELKDASGRIRRQTWLFFFFCYPVKTAGSCHNRLWSYLQRNGHISTCSSYYYHLLKFPCSRLIIIINLKPYSNLQIVCIRLEYLINRITNVKKPYLKPFYCVQTIIKANIKKNY